MAFPYSDSGDASSTFGANGTYDNSGGTADPSLGTNVLMPDGTYQNFPPDQQPYIFISDRIPGGWAAAAPGTEEYTHYKNVMRTGDYQGAIQVGLLVGGAALAGYLSDAAAAGASTTQAQASLGNVGVTAGGAGSGSAAGGGTAAITSPYEAGGGSIFGSGTAGGIGDSIIATGGVPVAAAAAGLPGAAGAIAGGTAGAGAMIDPGGIPDVTVPPGATQLPTTVPPTPLDPNATMQPFPAPPAGLGNAVGDVVSGASSGAGTAAGGVPSAPGGLSASDVPDWLKYLLPGLDAVGGYLAADKSSQAQADAYQAAIAEQKRQFDLMRSDYAPYLAAGTGALTKLQDPGTYFATSPGYEFRRSEGDRGVTNSYGAAGGAFSGNALKALADYNQKLASGEFGQWWNQQSGLAGTGQTATNAVSQIGQNNANATGTALIGQGDARGTGVLGKYGSIIGGANNYYRSLYPTGP